MYISIATIAASTMKSNVAETASPKALNPFLIPSTTAPISKNDTIRPPINVAININGFFFSTSLNNLKPSFAPSITGLIDTSIPINELALACACSISSELKPNSEPKAPTTPVASANPPAIPCPTFSICSPFF